MFPGFAFANGDSNTKTIYGTKAVVEDDGTYRDYNTHIRVKIDQNGTIISVEDIDARLSQLHNVIYKENVTPSEIKETILNLIISDKNS